MRAIQRFLRQPRHIELHRIFVAASPENAWNRARHFDMSEVPWVRFLFQVRTLSAKFSGEKIDFKNEGIGIDQIERENNGFKILFEDPGKEVVVGSIGQYWHLKMVFAEFDHISFADFKDPGWGKIAWAITVEPYKKGSTISFELRISATDEDSWKSFKNYYHLIGLGSKLIRKSLMDHLEIDLKKQKREDPDSKYFPGDEILPLARHTKTNSILIEAPASIVWKYLMQMGCDRGGWYSIDWLDNGGKPSINHQVMEWEDRKVGDRISATPSSDQFFEVYKISRHQHFVIGGEANQLGLVHDYKVSWSFLLEPVGDDATRLLVKAKMQGLPSWGEWLQSNFFALPAHTIMQSVQLKNIKRLAERDAGLSQPNEDLKASIITDIQHHESIQKLS